MRDGNPANTQPEQTTMMTTTPWAYDANTEYDLDVPCPCGCAGGALATFDNSGDATVRAVTGCGECGAMPNAAAVAAVVDAAREQSEGFLLNDPDFLLCAQYDRDPMFMGGTRGPVVWGRR